MSTLALPDRFPGLERLNRDGRRYVHADAAGGTHVGEAVLAAMINCLRQSNSNPNRPHSISREAAAILEDGRDRFGEFADADPAGVVFGANATSLTWHFARAFERELNPGDVIVCTQLDHEANVSPWLAIAERRGAEVRFVRLDPATYEPDLRSLETAVDDRTRVVAFTRASNLTGTVVSPQPFIAAARAVGALTYADAVHAAAHFPLRQRALGVDVQVCSPYKFFGPHMGVLAVRPDILERLAPDRVRPAPTSGAKRWEMGMSSLEAVAGLRASLRYLQTVGHEAIADHEHKLTERALRRLAEIPHVQLHGRDTVEDRTPTFALSVDGHTPEAVALELGQQGVLVSAGANHALETIRALDLDERAGVVRVGFAHYHPPEDVDRVFAALAAVAAGERPVLEQPFRTGAGR
jgi:cysteine desulfurase family protein (TIGR01976 family)